MRYRQQPLNTYNVWQKDGESDGFLIKIKIEDENIEKNYTLPTHPLGRVPVRIQILDSSVPTGYPGVIFKDREKIVLYFTCEPATILLRIE